MSSTRPRADRVDGLAFSEALPDSSAQPFGEPRSTVARQVIWSTALRQGRAANKRGFAIGEGGPEPLVIGHGTTIPRLAATWRLTTA